MSFAGSGHQMICCRLFDLLKTLSEKTSDAVFHLEDN